MATVDPGDAGRQIAKLLDGLSKEEMRVAINVALVMQQKDGELWVYDVDPDDNK